MREVHEKWPGFSASHTLIISIDSCEFGLQPDGLVFDEKPFKPKPETHITIFGTAICERLLHRMQLDPATEDRLIQAFEATDWSYTTTDDYRHLARTATDNGDRTEESIIVLLKMKGISDFYDNLKQQDLIDDETPLPPPHVTLYTYNCDTGIGVPSASELDRLSHSRIDRQRLTTHS